MECRLSGTSIINAALVVACSHHGIYKFNGDVDLFSQIKGGNRGTGRVEIDVWLAQDLLLTSILGTKRKQR